MVQLKSNLNPELLFELMSDIVSNSASDYSFLETGEKAHVTTHELVFEDDDEILKFSVKAKDFLSSFFGKKVPAGRSNYGNSEAQYSTFVSLFTTQAGTVRILWLHGKILSMLVGSKPQAIIKSKEDPIEFSPYYFGFSADSKANLTLSDEDKATLMTIPVSSWLVAKNRNSKVTQNNPESSKSLAIAHGYVRHGSIEKVEGVSDLFLLLYPKSSSNFFSSGGTWGSGLPSLCMLMHGFEYHDLLETQLVNTGDWNRYRDYDNSAFMASKDVTEYIENKVYYRFSFKSVHDFHKMRSSATTKDLIGKKYAVFTAEDKAKYFDNPRYDVVYSLDKTMFFVRKSDKLKATALQTRITKSLREDFIHFLNWIGYYQLAADLNPANMAETFMPVKLVDLKAAKWVDTAPIYLQQQKANLNKLATDEYRSLYMNESASTVTPFQNSEIFKAVFSAIVRNVSYHNRVGSDLDMILTNQFHKFPLSFNKKFGLDINLSSILLSFARGITTQNYADSDKAFYKNSSDVISFLSTNFLLSDSIENAFEAILKNDSEKHGGGICVTNSWHLDYNDNIKAGQLLKTCVTLSPEALAIFNSVASLTTPTDILSWLELSKEHFTQVLPKVLVTKYGNKIATEAAISTMLSTGIDYYMAILSAAEPFSNKLLNADDTGE